MEVFAQRRTDELVIGHLQSQFKHLLIVSKAVIAQNRWDGREWESRPLLGDTSTACKTQLVIGHLQNELKDLLIVSKEKSHPAEQVASRKTLVQEPWEYPLTSDSNPNRTFPPLLLLRLLQSLLPRL